MEVKTTCNTYWVDYICDNCNNGFMLKIDMKGIQMNSKKIPHKCSNALCFKIEYLDKQYPYMDMQRTVPEAELIKMIKDEMNKAKLNVIKDEKI